MIVKRRQSWSEVSGSFSYSAEDDHNQQYKKTILSLDEYYRQVKQVIISNQSMFGLFPAHHIKGKSNVSMIRDSIFCASCIWALRQCYQHIDNDKGRSYELGQTVVKSMRAILFCWMQQSSMIEQFKTNQCPEFALHSIFTLDGKEVITHEKYGHLQIGTVSLYLIFLAQMIESGLQIIYSVDEVAFIQQLIFYIERAYRTPDFGFWGRGSKYNDHTPELHAR
ncbi:hypothetical protein GJ496_000240 [Pomphorhynchus laevis]|nr:hypothetical protein GJ496_000240 [Pomphorhynchus laevis]